MDLSQLTIKKIRQGLESKEFSSVDLTKEYLKQIEMRDKSIGAFLSVEKDYALDAAKNKKVSALSGAPCAIKDNIMVEGLKCTAASKILENYIAPYDATVIKKLKEAGAIILGKTNLDEFAMGASTENSGLKMTRNPVDLDRVPGGSSGGSAAAVASGQCCFSLGSDTGGSIRQPASFCGLVGFKPSYGAVSRYGLIAFASSLDQIGPITKNVEDARIVFDIIRGKDKMDSTSVNLDNIENCKFNLPAGKAGIENLRVGVPKEYFIDGMDKEVEKSVREAIKKIEKHGAKIKEISLPHTEYAVACYYIIAPAEASANLARFDGIKYGLSENKNGNLLDVYLQTRGKGFGAEVKRRIMLGTYSLSSGYYDAYYKKAQQVRALIKEDFDKAFGGVDIILTPTAPTTAFKIGEKADDPLSMYLADIFTVSANLAGLPALSLPAGRQALPCGKANGLPIGLQIIGKQFDDYKVLDAAYLIEKILQ